MKFEITLGYHYFLFLLNNRFRVAQTRLFVLEKPEKYIFLKVSIQKYAIFDK
jgi:hypothetical protein